MTIETARDILSQLLDGVNPVTGECLPDDDVCCQPDVTRALHTALAVMGEQKRHRPREAKPNAGRPWTDSEIASLKHMFWEGMSAEQIAPLL